MLKNQQKQLKGGGNLKQKYQENINELENATPEMKATKKLNFAQTAAAVEQPMSHDIESLRQTFEFKLNVLKNEMDHNLTGLSRRAPDNSSID